MGLYYIIQNKYNLYHIADKYGLGQPIYVMNMVGCGQEECWVSGCVGDGWVCWMIFFGGGRICF